MYILRNNFSLTLRRAPLWGVSPLESHISIRRFSTGATAKRRGYNNGLVATRLRKYRNLSTSTSKCSSNKLGSNDASSGVADDADLPSAEDSTSISSTTFVKLLTSVNDDNMGLVMSLKKLKDELQYEGTRSYPFRARDLPIITEFVVKMLLLRDDELSVDTLCSAIELFKADGGASAAFHLCRLFSSYNNCHGRTVTSSVFQRVVHNRIGMFGAKMLSQKKMDKLNENYIDGAKCALNFVVDAITDGDFSGLRGCCERGLYDFFNQGMNYLERIGLKLDVKITDIKDVKMDVFLLTIGGHRGDTIQAPYIMKQAVGHQILVSLPKSPISGTVDMLNSRKQNRELIMQTFEKGAIARMEVLLKVRQALRLLDTGGNVLWEDPRKLITHKLTLESAIYAPSRESEGTDPTDWTVVDVNGILNGNPPFTSSAE
ncbi:hypothetical protein BBOV_III003250 [Babesia bovis T2Bo]|uniref:hypothetical protein n=1 Tax=Babesia bovis T2Bo TaxID=484906 RepID=UPI001C36519A|nr:hypothetical protein BBOV_III003250 [Babesia bovis T2Bo]EDO07889.2 hypothetical protein BBOV_III003250 [Babesia bovis T2Bo]